MTFDKAQEQWYPNDPVFYCHECEKKILDEDDLIDANGVWVCEDCFEKYYGRCTKCGDIIANDDLVEFGHELLCVECLAEQKE